MTSEHLSLDVKPYLHKSKDCVILRMASHLEIRGKAGETVLMKKSGKSQENS